MPKLGTVILGPDPEHPVKELEITDLVRSTFKDHRLCTIARTEEGTFVLSVENPQSSGRATMSQMHVTEESMLSLVSCVCLYYHVNQVDMDAKLRDVAEKDSIQYEHATKNDDDHE